MGPARFELATSRFPPDGISFAAIARALHQAKLRARRKTRKKAIFKHYVFYGGPGQIRTGDLAVNSRTLQPLSYRATWQLIKSPFLNVSVALDFYRN